MKFFKHAGLAIAALLACSSAQAILIDDYNVATASSVSDSSLDATATSAASVIDGTNIVMGGAAGWTRDITASLTAGADVIETIVCNGCQAAHVNAQNPATGIGEFIYSGSAVVFDGTGISFDYTLDIAGTILNFYLSNGDVLTTGPLAATLTGGSVNVSFGSGDYSAITSLTVEVVGTQAADFTIDNLRTVPTPASLLLLALGALGLGLRKKA